MTVTFFLAISFEINATAPPFKGGSLYIQSMDSESKDCKFRKDSHFPTKVRQYFYDGKAMRQIRLDNEQVQISEISLKQIIWEGYITSQKVAIAMQDQEYPCAFHISFNPSLPSQHNKELRRIQLNIGKIKNERGVWYWAPIKKSSDTHHTEESK